MHGLSSAVDRKEDPSNLESVLLDQKMRVEKHRMNFETLKSQHILLQEVSNPPWLLFVFVYLLSVIIPPY